MPIRCRSFVSTTRGTIVPERPGFRSYGSNVARRPVNWGAGVPGRFGQEVKLRLDHPFGVRDVPPVRTQADPIRLSGPGPGGGIGSPSTRRPIKRSIPQDPVQRRDAPAGHGVQDVDRHASGDHVARRRPKSEGLHETLEIDAGGIAIAAGGTYSVSLAMTITR